MKSKQHTQKVRNKNKEKSEVKSEYKIIFKPGIQKNEKNMLMQEELNSKLRWDILSGGHILLLHVTNLALREQSN